MQREDKFGYGFLLASIGIPVLIVVIWGEKFAAAVVGSMFVVGGIAFLIAGHQHAKTAKKRTKMATVGMFILVGALMGASIGLLSGISYLTLKQKSAEPKAEPKDETTQKQIRTNPLIEASWELSMLPIHIPPEMSVFIIRFFQDLKVNAFTFQNGNNYIHKWPTPQRLSPPESMMIFKISNHDKGRIYNLRTSLQITFFDSGEPSRKVLARAEQEIGVDSLAPGEIYSVYLVNESQYVIDVPMPSTAMLQVEGSTDKQRVNIVPHGPLSDINAGFPTDEITLPLMPSNHRWKLDRPIQR